MVVQAALFAGFLSAFLIELLNRLNQDPMDVIQDVLIYQTQMMRNSSLGPYVPADFSPPEYIVVVNALFYASLGVMILAAFIAMLIKSWVREFDRGLQAMSLPEQRAKTREFRYLGLEYWKLPEVVAVLPLLIQISLLLFAIGLVLFLFYISTPSFGVTTAIFGIGVVYYAITTSISVFATSSPFHSPLSRGLGTVYRRVHAYFCPYIDYFLSRDMDTTPGTAMGRLRRAIQIFLQKSRPFPERDFVDPVAPTTMDEIQLSIAASALQRVHDSVPNSQHSESVLWSVWQVAGNPTLRTPSLLTLPSWIIGNTQDEEYFSRFPPAMVVSLLAVSLRTPWCVRDMTSARSVLQRVDNSKTPWARLVIAIFDHFLDNYVVSYSSLQWCFWEQPQSNDLPTFIEWAELRPEDSIWLLNTLSDLCSHESKSDMHPFSVGVCLAILSHQPRTFAGLITPDIGLLETVITLVTISKSDSREFKQDTLSSSRQHPWLLPNLRNPECINSLMEGPPSSCHKELISLLFLVLYGLVDRGSYLLVSQYVDIINKKSDFTLCASALTAVAPFMNDYGLYYLAGIPLTCRTQDMASVADEYRTVTSRTEMFLMYDGRLGASQIPDPNFLAILLLLSDDYHIDEPRDLDPELKNPWLKLAERVVNQLDIPDEPGLDIRPFPDHRVNNIIAALSLLRYTEGTSTEFTDSVLLASFLESQEFVISSFALEYYMRTIISYDNLPAPSCYLSCAICAIFNAVLPDDRLRMGWMVLEIFMDGFDTLSVEWRQAFADAFFAPSRQPLPRSPEGQDTTTPESELAEILTWEYFHKEEEEYQFTDLDFCGLDWMAMAWSLHLSQRCETALEDSTEAPRAAQSQDSGRPTVNEEFILQVLCKLLDAAPHYRIIPITRKLWEFIHWFNDIESFEYRSMISAHVKQADRGAEEVQMLHRFDKFECMWYN